MSHLLQQTHNLLKHLQANGTSTRNNESLTECLISAKEEIQNFQSGYLQLAAAAPSVESLRILTDITAIACVDSANGLFLASQEAVENKEVQLELSGLASSLEENLSWLFSRFNSYITKGLAMPLGLAAKELSALQQVLLEIQGNDHRSDQEWITVLSNLVRKTFETPGAFPSYSQASCLKSLAAAIREISVIPSDDTILDGYAKSFISCDCNDISVIQFLVQKIEAGVNDSLSDKGRIEKWQWLSKEITQVRESGTVLHPDEDSVKTILLSLINTELAWLVQKEQVLSSVYGSRMSSAPVSGVFTPLLTTLSVSQLAVWCRLLSGCDILKHDNQTELLKLVAGALQTTRAANISADSLRAKYYSPDRASLAVVKEHLFRMINLVKDM